MKKVFSICLTCFLSAFICLSAIACKSFYCDPKGKDWYNLISLPTIENPLNEIYDSSYSIEIEKDGDVIFTPLNGEPLKGTITTSRKNNTTRTQISIQFENGQVVSGECYKSDAGRTLEFRYNYETYRFTNKRQLSKEEFETYRKDFIGFLTNVYETNAFPTQEEIENNTFYRQITNYRQIDPCCNGPIEYETVERATIENAEIAGTTAKLIVNASGDTFDCSVYSELAVYEIIDGEIKELSFNEIRDGNCLISRSKFWNGTLGIYEYGVARIFYLEENPTIISMPLEIESQFDLTEEKIWWKNDSTVDFADDTILVCFKYTATYPELSIEDFNFDNAERIEYLFLRPNNGAYNKDFTQIAQIYLKEKGRDKVIEAVRYFERISIILVAEPNYIYGIEETI